MVSTTELSERILTVKLRAIGDTVIWTSALRALKKAKPQAIIDVLTFEANKSILENNPDIGAIHTIKNHSFFELLGKALSLRSQKYDVLIGFHAADSICKLAPFFGAKKVILHHHSRFTKPFFANMEVHNPGTLEDAISRDYRTLEPIVGKLPHEPTKIYITKEEKSWALKEIGIKNQNSYFVFLPGASHHLRRYPKDLWLELLKNKVLEGKYQCLVVCDQALSQEWNLKEECKKLVVPLFDHYTLKEFMALVSLGERALANDSGPGHMAVALGLRTSFIFGPGCVGDWHCYDKTMHPLFRTSVDCRHAGPRNQEQFQYCAISECSHHSCMRKLQVQI